MQRLRRFDAILSTLGWALPWTVVLSVLIVEGDIAEALFFELPAHYTVVVRLVVALSLTLMCVRLGIAVALTHRVLPSVLLGLSMLAYAGGRVITLVMPQADAGHQALPSPGEAFFFASCLLLAMFVFVDAPRVGLPRTPVLVDAGIATGCTICVGALLVANPLRGEIPASALAEVVALFYPMFDLLLLAILVAEIVAGARALEPRTGAYLLAFGGLLISDSLLVMDRISGVYDFGVLVGALWISSHLLLVAVAGMPARAARRPQRVTRERHVYWPGVTVLAAVAVLIFVPQGSLRTLVIAPAAASIALAGWRLALSIKLARASVAAQHLAQLDALTELPNRRAVETLITRLDGEGRLGRRALLILDINDFADLNDSLGSHTGDAVLRAVANELGQVPGPVEMVARVGDNEFALAVTCAPTQGEWIREFAQNVRTRVAQPITIDGLSLRIDCAIGIGFADGGPTDELLRRADVAIRQAKRAGGSRVVVYQVDDDDDWLWLRSGQELRGAIARGEIVLWYQPKIAVGSGLPVGVEALVRWADPDGGLRPPSQFLPIARRSGLMPQLTDAVIRAALADLRGWVGEGLNIPVAINVAPPELLGGAVYATLDRELKAHHLPGESVMIEVTEESFIADPDAVRAAINELRELGVSIAIDDYGTGYSSLSHLRALPVEEIKIDRTFIQRVLSDGASRMIIDTTVRLAHALDLHVVAEGVESADVAQALQELDVDVLQGYLYSGPMPAALVAGWFQRQSTMPVVSRPRLRRYLP